MLHIITVLLSCVSISAFAKVDYSKTKPFVFPTKVEDNRDYRRIASMAPTELEPTSDQSRVLKTVVDKGAQYIWDNSGLKNSALGRKADELQKKIQTDLVLSEAQGENKIEHKVNFQVLVAQAIAKLEYTGWVKAAFKYYAGGGKSEAEISEKIWDNKDLVLSHIADNSENRSALSMRWDW